MPRPSEERRSRYTNAREQADKQSSGLSATFLKMPEGAVMFKPKAGTMLLDILPFVAGEGNPNADAGAWHWERTFWVHRSVGVNQDWYLCPAKNYKRRCPICEHRLKLMKEADDENEELIKSLSPSQRQLFNVINLKDPDKGIQLWEISHHCFGKTLYSTLRAADEGDEWEKFFFLDDGLTLRVSFVEDSFGGVSFMKAERIDFKVRREQYDDEKIKETYRLDKLLIEPSYEELKKVYLSAESDDDDDEPPKKKRVVDDDDDEPPKARKRDADDDDDEPPKKKKVVDEDDDDDPPKKRKVEEDDDDTPKARKKPKDDDDWDDFDDDDDDPPKSKRKSEDDDDDEPPKKKKVVDEDDDDDPPKKKKNRFDDDDDDDGDKPRVRAGKDRNGEDDDDDDPPKARKKPKDDAWDEDDDDEPPKKKKVAVDEDD